MVKISAVIITLNEEKNIERCIHSLQRVADEIVVVDSFSTDRTQEICNELGVRFIQHKFEGYRDQKNYALSQATYDHIVSLDADEALSVELELEIMKIKNNWQYDGYKFKRLNNYCGRWIYHTDWYPEYRIRLFDRRKCEWKGANIHETVKLNTTGTVSKTKGNLLHWRYASYEDHVAEINKYSSISAIEYYKKGATSGVAKTIFHSFWRFIHSYILRAGFLEGVSGLTISLLIANLCYLKYAKLHRLNRKNPHSPKKRKPNAKPKHSKMPMAVFPSTNQPLASVIITTYNQPEWLRKTLWGFEHQTIKGFEVIIADDGSNNETKTVIDEFYQNNTFRLKHVWHPDNGFQKCTILNKAIVQSTSDYLIFTDGDCIPRNDFIEVHLKHAQKGYFLSGGYFKLNKKVSDAVNYNDVENGNPFKVKWLLKSGQNFQYKFLKFIRNRFVQFLLNQITPTKATWNGHNVSGWKSDIIAVNGYNENMQYGGLDRELGERLFNYGIKSKQIRYSAICVHLDHSRPYRTKSTLDKNKKIRKSVVKDKIIWVDNGIDKHIKNTAN
ncbi:MAG TPA: glycosyltransferase [Tenuifilaceae bacterium]|nr:glycosyltransferase [Tenuifilaceae bacterium]